ncbi:hypothetical protein C2G38_2032003 [Gigaspora rosea]|uniref:SAM domain-containing protein n=1 Tax=Gigaspora rosea TaxID=44941 RepID=A0A397VP43_9GLOM|nr:hypothetical protein C2G38_2032003 [Gigaspora rosea]
MSENFTLPSVEDVQKWKRADVINFLQKNKDKLDLDDKHIKVIENEEVAGDFLELDAEKLIKYGLKGGPAERIAKLVRDIKGEGEVEKPSMLKEILELKKELEFLRGLQKKLYSEWTFNDVSNIFKLPAHYKNLPKFTCGIDKFEDKKSQELILHLIKELNIRQSTVRGDSEAYNSHFVIPFLAVASSICGDKAQIYPEEYIQGRYGRGPVDFCMILENIIISVVEVKRDDFIQGAAQIIVQLHSSLENSRKRKREVENDLVIDKVYGIVTDSKCWYFFECSMNGDKPEYKIHSEHGTTINWGGNIEEGVTEVLGQVVWLLKDAERLIESAKQKKAKLAK